MYATANPTADERAELIAWHTEQANELDRYADSFRDLDRYGDAGLWQAIADQHRAKVNELTATDPLTAEQAHRTIDQLGRLARMIDADYSEACADTCCTNERPQTDAHRLVWLLHSVAFTLNGCGLGEREGVARLPIYDLDAVLTPRA